MLFSRIQRISGSKTFHGGAVARSAALSLFLLCVAAAPAGLEAAEPPEQPAPELEAGVDRIPDYPAYQHFLKGYLSELAGDPDTALGEYREALRYDGDSPFLLSSTAQILARQNELKEALPYAEMAARLRPDDLKRQYFLAAVYAGMGNIEGALGVYNQVTARNPKNSEAWLNRGGLEANIRRYDDAAASVKKGMALDPGNAYPYYLLGRIYAEKKEFGKAIAEYKKATRINPQFDAAYMAVAVVYELQGKDAEAIAEYKSLLKEGRGEPNEALDRLMRLLLEKKKMPEVATHLREIVEANPDNLEARVRLGLVYGDMKEYQKGIEQLKVVLGERPGHIRVLDSLGYLYEGLKDYMKAESYYKEAIGHDPNFVDGYLHLGYLYGEQKRYPDAVSYYKKVVEMAPERPEGYIYLGLAYMDSERYNDAVVILKEGVVKDPDSPDLHFNLGAVYDKLNRFDDTVGELQKTIELDPKHANALNYLGYSYADRGIQLKNAVDLIKRALEVKPEDGYYVDSLGWAFYKMGKTDEALRELERAVVLVPDDPTIHEHLGDIYNAKQMKTNARNEWVRSLELDPNNKKLIDRFKEAGFGDPELLESIQKAKQKREADSVKEEAKRQTHSIPAAQ